MNPYKIVYAETMKEIDDIKAKFFNEIRPDLDIEVKRAVKRFNTDGWKDLKL